MGVRFANGEKNKFQDYLKPFYFNIYFLKRNKKDKQLFTKVFKGCSFLMELKN